ncbi:MAG: amidohydrolase family protein [Acidobacteria bacterium]|nr:amidohydrolase family protein [Acidobacteriota bacterium]
MKRAFRWVTLLSIAAFPAVCPATARPPDEAGEPLPVIDAHMHTIFTGEREAASRIRQTREELLKEMKENHVVGAVSHTGDTYSRTAKVKYADPLTLDEVAVDHPKVRFVIAHCGNPWTVSAAEVVFKNPNVYVDLSGIMIGDLSQFAAEDLDTYLIKPIRWMYRFAGNPRKFLYGSDWPLVPMGQYIRAIRKAIPPEDWKAVFHDNAVELFRMKMAEP